MELLRLRREIDFFGQRRIATILSVILVLVSLGSLATRQLNLGIDFTGGVLLEAGYQADADLGAIRSDLEAAGYADAQVQNFGAARDVLIRIPPREDIDAEGVGEELLGVLRASGQQVDLRRVEFVGPQVGQELTERGGLAVLFALLMILLYVMFRFQWKFAVGSVAALAHDVIIILGIFSVFQLPFDLTILAAALAVIGYSLNDTIVVFDRIRENFRRIRTSDAQAVMNTSVNQMLGRTVITSLTTLLVLIALFLFGGEALKGFSSALIIGVVVGTYSSIYVAGNTALALNVSTVDLLPPKKETANDGAVT
ncbi:MAG: protein translocase subunit SecF [Gammaproteobacteria bacterium]|nr:protein translocase subunit SecF [Gammaproteobacteria bacterium]MYD02247.1 protein translocase subunit SecF [Gammaproteobacteria bacterium]MYI24711.1 protein translocase subunit SecF [Gammaproteobacteria bacterium]